MSIYINKKKTISANFKSQINHVRPLKTWEFRVENKTRGLCLNAAADMSYKRAKKLPEQVRAPAVFKCVRVTAVEGGGSGGNEYAYQAVVKIGGHVFKGYLYDHGVEAREGFPMLSDLHLGGGGDGGSTSSPIIDPSDVYGSSAGRGGGLAGGSGYGNPIN